MHNSHKAKTVKMVFSAMFAAFVFAGTQLVRVPLPVGYFNFGDCFIILAALTIGSPYAVFASAAGSALADILTGYTIYAPATLVIKSVMVAIAASIFKAGACKSAAVKTVLNILGAVCAELVMVCGYFVYETVLYSFSGAVVSLMGNALQGAVSVITSIVIFEVFQRIGVVKYFKRDK